MFRRLIFACMALLASTSHADDAIRIEAVKVSPHVYYFQGQAGMASAANRGFMSNAGFVITTDGVVAFDALATPVLGQAMIDAIGRITKQPIRRVILSHYHADHFYGLQAFKAAGAEVWAHENGKIALNSDALTERLAQRRVALAPWVNAQTRLVPADKWLSFGKDKEINFEMGGVHFRLLDAAGTHSAEDLMLEVIEEKVLFAGDLYATGRLPFVGDADSRAWLKELERMQAMKPAIVIPGHGAASSHTMQDMQLTRDYLLYLRQTMGQAAQDLTPFDEAYAKTDWRRFAGYTAFEAANRLNAYATYILMEKESLQKQ
jgi:glyoxylase-like metal-dependent hydrolase (beta-lactamase superfamily II)